MLNQIHGSYEISYHHRQVGHPSAPRVCFVLLPKRRDIQNQGSTNCLYRIESKIQKVKRQDCHKDGAEMGLDIYRPCNKEWHERQEATQGGNLPLYVAFQIDKGQCPLHKRPLTWTDTSRTQPPPCTVCVFRIERCTCRYKRQWACLKSNSEQMFTWSLYETLTGCTIRPERGPASQTEAVSSFVRSNDKR